MSRVLLVCPEPLGHGSPAGVGIRFLEFTKALHADGHHVTVLSADGGDVPNAISGTLSAESIQLHTAKNEVAVVQGHIANELFAHGRPMPSVVDLYDPFIIENFHYYEQHGAQVFAHDHKTMLNSLSRGDLFLCASSAQRLFYLGMLTALGRLNPALFASDPSLSTLLQIVPFGVQAARPAQKKRTSHDILFGGIYDWYDPILAIEAAAMARQDFPELTLTFTKHPNPEITPQGAAAAAIRFARDAGYDFVRFEPWTAYEQRGEFFDRFGLALLTFPQSLETDLSMRTRIFDFLWGGLPVVTSSAPGTDEILERHHAGIVVSGNDPAPFATAMRSILQNDALHQSMRDGSAQFTREHQWQTLAEPLLAFCRNPRSEPTRQAFAWSPELPSQPATMLDRLRRRIGGAF